eukprot:CAMPEP_0183304672 /NCGR_PEP_ID=MMETSP0160_2-20130417/9684_1 /TAXON_ID=2839 ORGANISM="Odontella Sinensis, Strain Grunow 1884" /NCGR_SAMPLE_ID=MMETSP0160_2 /ASSEMBLY_ACC=CAM_ASM_000250 /LENGTH=70 /DNA_ID=CAMNT_0025467767 /DNA_START=93 /DNA_END=305 /DNA_ORIENTATION=-
MTTPTTFWRLAGMSYTQYVTRAASAMRAGLKEPAKSKAMQQEKFAYNQSVWEAGEQGKKALIETLSKAGK